MMTQTLAKSKTAKITIHLQRKACIVECISLGELTHMDSHHQPQ